MLAVLVPGTARADQSLDGPLERLRAGGHVLMLRHALAPGTGDPAGFRLDDCTTQRTLDAAGRDQARAIGKALRAAGITRAAVFSSQWCRCLETAELLGLGPVTELPALNSFFGPNRDRRSARMTALRAFLAERPVDGPPVVLVTHQVNVTALTGDFVRSGEGRLLRLDGTDTPEVLGRVMLE
ncbi:histidine phosphatase family protein [Marivibrio halodurans]|uniref:Histidine phosphatase family protein n=2 Tax=Marivibrio halodurans TaxID=2039722 RepID=A0A8J7S4N5_9PROT|nr:histidine phosphatase family protein [Marivibrio halodurans]